MGSTAPNPVTETAQERALLSPRMMVAVIWLIAAVMVLSHHSDLALYDVLSGPDDHARLARIKAFLDGAGWYDDVLMRMNAPDGAVLHWSRLPDLFPVGVTLGLELLFGRETALHWAMMATPLVMLGVLLVGLFWAARPLLPGQGAAAAALVMVVQPSMLEVMPGRIDHHNWMMVALALGLGFMLRLALTGDVRRGAILAGTAFGVAVGVTGESLIALAIISAGCGVLWLWHGAVLVPALRRFGLALVIAGLVMLPVTHPPSSLFTVMCDRYGAVYFAILAAVATFWWFAPGLAARFKPHWISRAGSAAVVGSVLLGALAMAFPACRGGAMSAVPPDQWTSWLGEAGGMQPLWVKPAQTIVLVGTPVVLALLVTLWAVFRRSRERALWLAVLTVVVLGALAMLSSARSHTVSGVIAVIPLAWLLVRMAQACEYRWQGWRRAITAFPACAVVLVAPIGFAQAMTSLWPAAAGEDDACGPSFIAEALATLPADTAPGIMAAPIFAGPFIWTASAHDTLGAQYHRNIAGNRKAHAIISAETSGAARDLIQRFKVEYVAVCEHGHHHGSDFYHALAAKTPPSWLRLISDPSAGPYLIYAVTE